MKVTEQIDAMEVSGSNPFKYLVLPRLMLACQLLHTDIETYFRVDGALVCITGTNWYTNNLPASMDRQIVYYINSA